MSSSDQDFTGRVAIVTGGATGIGLATARRLARGGARVAIAGHTAARNAAALEALTAQGAAAPMAIECDVGVESDVRRTVDTVIGAAGRWDLLVNNAAVMPHEPLASLATEDWLRCLAVNLLGPFYFVREALARMSPGGAIVNVASVHALRSQAGAAPYAASKAALLALTRSTAVEAADRRIRANALVPGAFDTAMLHDNPAVRSGAEKLDPKAVGDPADAAEAIAFLASDAARFVNGATLVVDGGRFARL